MDIGEIYQQIKEESYDTETLKATLENQLQFIENQLLPDIDLINKEMVGEQIDIASAYIMDLETREKNVDNYKSRINEINKTYRK